MWYYSRFVLNGYQLIVLKDNVVQIVQISWHFVLYGTHRREHIYSVNDTGDFNAKMVPEVEESNKSDLTILVARFKYSKKLVKHLLGFLTIEQQMKTHTENLTSRTPCRFNFNVYFINPDEM